MYYYINVNYRISVISPFLHFEFQLVHMYHHLLLLICLDLTPSELRSAIINGLFLLLLLKLQFGHRVNSKLWNHTSPSVGQQK
jgi:hypothetical protein